MRAVNIVGLDLGQSQDPTALVFLERPCWVAAGALEPYDGDLAGWVASSRLNPWQIKQTCNADGPTPPTHLLRGLKRYDLGTSYPAIVEDVARLVRAQRTPTQLIIDRTGCGAPVFDLFVAAGLDPIGVMITGGDQVHQDGNVYRIPKRDLVGVVQSLLQTRRLKFAEALPLLPVLKQELQNFRVKIDPKTAHDSYSAWRENQHDDMVLGCALACWWAERPTVRSFAANYLTGVVRSAR